MSLLLREETGHIARLTLNSPENYNALSSAMIAELHGQLDTIAEDDGIRVLIIAARGRAFCAGHDLHEMQGFRKESDGGRESLARLFAQCSDMMQALADLPQPVISEVQGIATAAGCQLVASCDLALAADGARFGVNGIDLGLFCATPMVALTRAIPPRAAFELLVTGQFADAETARQLGLVNRVTAPQDLTAQTMALAETIAAKQPQAVRMGKRAFRQQLSLGLAEAYELAGRTICENAMLPDTERAMQGFIDRRQG